MNFNLFNKCLKYLFVTFYENIRSNLLYAPKISLTKVVGAKNLHLHIKTVLEVS